LFASESESVGTASPFLLLHRHDPRLLAVLEALTVAGVAVTGVAREAAALRVLAAGPVAALLLGPSDRAVARACRAAHPCVGVIYLAALPWPPSAPPPAPGEQVLHMPFTEAEFRDALAALPSPPDRAPQFAGESVPVAAQRGVV